MQEVYCVSEETRPNWPGGHRPACQAAVREFRFYKVMEEFRALSESKRRTAKKSFLKALGAFKKDGILLTYSTLGFRADVGFSCYGASATTWTVSSATARNLSRARWDLT